MTTKKWIIPAESAAIYGKTPRYWRDLAISGKIVSSKATGQYLLEVASIEALLRGESPAQESTKPELPESQVALIKERDDLILKIEVKELKAKLAGIFTIDDQEKLAKDRIAVDLDSAKLPTKERAIEEARDELKAQRKDLKSDKDKWNEIYEAGLTDLDAIRDYYQELCKHDSRAKGILEPVLELDPDWYNKVALPDQDTGSELDEGDDDFNDEDGE